MGGNGMKSHTFSDVCLLSLFLFFFLVSACNNSNVASPSDDGGPGLLRASTCDDAREYFNDVIQLQAQSDDDSGVDEVWGSDLTTDASGGSDDATSDSDLFPQETTSGDSAPDYSATNVQEEGVDETDIVKTDGEHLRCG